MVKGSLEHSHTVKILRILSMMCQENLGQSCAVKCTDIVQGKLCNPLQFEVKFQFQEEDQIGSQMSVLLYASLQCGSCLRE